MTPKILLLDIETAPGIAYVWSLFDDTVTIDRLIEPGRTICWGAQWLGEKKFLYADERGGAELMHREIHKLLSSCDAVVTYNGLSYA